MEGCFVRMYSTYLATGESGSNGSL